MGFLPAWLNPFDVLIAFALLAGIAFGFVQGLVRMALSLLVLYIAIVLGMTLYTPLGRWIRYLIGSAISETMSETIAFVLIIVLVYGIASFVLRRTYKDTELPGIRQIDQLGGMVVGLILTCTWIGLALVAMAFVLNATDMAASTLRENMLLFFHSSKLIPIFSELLPIFLVTLRPWMPKGLPPDIFSLRLFQ